ncbi:MAG TPA: methyltransferase domain-containing protein [Phycisphaerae bacterium]|jgi:SAM-dependent methyltransferase|nr:methyltransferase domain-containing protein [Phycisphaerae bacterium]
MTTATYDLDMQKMFAAVSDLYARYWGNYFHFAIFENEAQPWEQALENTHRAYMNALKVGQARRVLDIACGRGGFARLMAENTPGEVLGIDISESQLSHARRLERPNLRFRRHDAMKIDELGQTFDAVSFLDAACYLPDKLLAMRRIRHVMEPGARLLLVDWCRRERLGAVQQDLVLAPFMKYWGVPYLETRGRYEHLFSRNGYRLLHVDDLNDRVAPNWELGYRRALQALAELTARDLPKLIWNGMRLGKEGIELIKDQFPAAVYIKIGFDIGFLRYVYFLVQAA